MCKQACELARLAGQVMAMQSALGLVCRIRSRYLLHCIAPAAAAMNYSMLVDVPERARAEIELWANDLRELPVMPLTPTLQPPRRPRSSQTSARAPRSSASTASYRRRSGASLRLSASAGLRERAVAWP